MWPNIIFSRTFLAFSPNDGLATSRTSDKLLLATDKGSLQFTEFNCHSDEQANFCVAVARDSQRAFRIFLVQFLVAN